MDPADDIRTHASHVSGTIIAGGVNPSARGMAYEATGHIYSAEGYLNEIAEAAAEGLLVSNHSNGRAAGWSNGEWIGDPEISTVEDWAFGIYNNEAAILDQIAYLAPYYLLIRSAGNENGEDGDGSFPADGPFDSMTGEAIAKNILAIGNVDPLVTIPRDADDVVLVSSSSWGPSDDGRIKPDLVAPGRNLLSASADGDDIYETLTGTSMSTPVAAGNAILLQQLHQLLFGEFMRAATLKGVMLHTTLDVGSSPGPDYSYGHGFLDANLASRVINEKGNLTTMEENTLVDQQTYETSFEVTDTSSPLIVSISWTDPAGNAINEAVLDPSELNLVNDLDLRVTAPGGTVSSPWILNPSNPSNPASTGDNFRDNYEKIEINTPSLGTYTVRISHKGSLTNNTQDYTLIATNLAREDHRNTYFWVGGSGSWTDPSAWSDQSGGTSIGSVPSQNDRVIFDVNSFSSVGTVDLLGDVSAHQLGWFVTNGSTINFSGNAINAFNSIALNSTISNSESTFRFATASNSIGSVLINSSNEDLIFELDQPGTEFVFSGQNITTKEVNLINGKLTVLDNLSSERITLSSTNPEDVSLDDIMISTSILDLGGFTTGELSVNNTKISFEGGIGQHQINANQPFQLPQLTVESGRLSVLQSGTVDSVKLSAGTTLSLANQVQISLADIRVEATSDARVNINAIGGTAGLMGTETAKFCLDFVAIENIDVSGNAKFVYEENSTLINANGWIGAACEDVLFAGFTFRSACAASTTFFEDLSDGNPNSWSWDFGDGNTSSDQSPRHAYTTPGNYTVSLTVEEGAESSTFSEDIEVIASSVEKPVIELQSGRLLTNTAGQFFQWFLDGIPIDGENSRLLSVTPGDGEYQVELSDQNCAALSDPFVVLNAEGDLDMPVLEIYPNPVSEVLFLFLKSSEFQNASAFVIDIGGRVIKTIHLDSSHLNNPIPIHVGKLDSGVYLVNVNNGLKAISKRIVVNK